MPSPHTNIRSIKIILQLKKYSIKMCYNITQGGFMQKYTKILLIILILLTMTACKEKAKETKKEETKVEEKIVTEEITEGTIEGYSFKEVDKPTDRVKIQMENGDIILIVLSNKDTPITIKNFKKLVSQNYYDGLIFHRVIKDFMIQTGDPTGTGAGGSEEEIKGEFSDNGVKNNLSHTRGVVSMARRGARVESAATWNSASSQFFIVHEDSTYLDGKYAAFGRVFAGMSAVDKIANAETDSNDKPLKEQKIKSIRFIEITKED